MADDLTALSDEELEERAREVWARREALRAEQREVQQEAERRRAVRDAEALVQGLSDEHRAALAQMIAPGGIASTAAVGKPGSDA